MDRAIRTTSAGWVSAIGHALAVDGLDIAAIFRELGLDAEVLTDPDAGDGYTLESFHQEIEVALADVSLPAKDREVLEALQAYGDGLLM